MEYRESNVDSQYWILVRMEFRVLTYVGAALCYRHGQKLVLLNFIVQKLEMVWMHVVSAQWRSTTSF